MVDTQPTSRNIPLPIQRAVRQRCGFGCVLCGLPLYEYDHINGWANVHEHVMEEITLLCDKHHKEVTNGLLPREQVIEANKNPYNLKTGVSKPLSLHFKGSSCQTYVGGNSFITQMKGDYTESIPIIVDKIPLIAFIMQDEHLLLNINLFDNNNHKVMAIVNNQLYYSTSPWDIQFQGNSLTIREGTRQLLIHITFEPPNKIIIDKGRLLCNGVEILIYNEHILITNNKTRIQGISVMNCHRGLIIGDKPNMLTGFFYNPYVNRYLSDTTESLELLKPNLAS